jgi:predicted CoA-substrate-specific enzyme activase
MKKCCMGVDIGSISTKGVVIDEDNEILASTYLWTEGNPIHAVKRVLDELDSQLAGQDSQVISVGTTGSARELIGTTLGAQLVKNEITAHAVGTLSRHPDVRTIFEIGGQDSKIIILENGIVIDYAMNTLCAAGTGSFLSSQSKRLGIEVEEFGEWAMRSTSPTKIAGRCTVFAESDLVHKIQIGHPLEDIIAGLCRAVVSNYLTNVAKGKNIAAPIVFQGGVSKNLGVVKAFEDVTGEPVLVDDIGHLMGAVGVAILARKTGIEKPFDFAVKEMEFHTMGTECDRCPNNCEIICVMRGDEFLDGWGNRCEIGIETVRKEIKATLVNQETVPD